MDQYHVDRSLLQSIDHRLDLHEVGTSSRDTNDPHYASLQGVGRTSSWGLSSDQRLLIPALVAFGVTLAISPVVLVGLRGFEVIDSRPDAGVSRRRRGFCGPWCRSLRFPPSEMFLGDAGSYFIGAYLAAVTVLLLVGTGETHSSR